MKRSYLLPAVASIVLAGTLRAASAPRSEAPRPSIVSDEAYSAILDFYQYDVELPLDARLASRVVAATYVREKVAFTGGRGDRVTAYVMLPKAGKAPFPVVLLIDGWTGGKDRWWEDDTWPRGGLVTKALAAEGIAALVMDAQFHGERAAKLGVPVDQLVCGQCQNTRREMIVESIVDHRRALDYLGNRGDIDTSRVGALGHSMGGIMTFALAAIEPRLKVGVACVTPARTDWVDERAVLPRTFAPRIRIPLLMLMGRMDGLYGEADARGLFERVASPDKALEWYEAGHRLPVDYVARSVAWLKERLK